jgi:hypothetical protein
MRSGGSCFKASLGKQKFISSPQVERKRGVLWYVPVITATEEDYDSGQIKCETLSQK